MSYDYSRIEGPHQSRRENFEELVSQLLILEYGAQPVDGAGGDEGIDCFRKNADGSIRAIAQQKDKMSHFGGSLGPLSHLRSNAGSQEVGYFYLYRRKGKASVQKRTLRYEKRRL